MACPLQVCGGKECRHVSSPQGARPETWLQRAAWTLESTGQSSSSWQRENWWLASRDQGVTKKVGFNICPGQREQWPSSLPVKLDLSSPHRCNSGGAMPSATEEGEAVEKEADHRHPAPGPRRGEVVTGSSAHLSTISAPSGK